MNEYPAKPIADHLATYGRYGDTVLVHMNPEEVRGLAALSPTGFLTTNPVTGQPEAFLPMLVPLLASYGGSALAAGAGASALGATMAGAAASGLATTAMTGDIERGLMSGIMGAGMGAAVGAAGTNAAEAAAAELAAAEAAKQAATESLTNEVAQQALSATVLPEAAAAEAAIASPAGPMAASTMPPAVQPVLPDPTTFNLSGGEALAKAPFSARDSLAAPFGQGSKFGSELMSQRSLIPMAIGAGQLAAADQQDAWDKEAAALMGDREKQRKDTYDDLQGAYRAAQPGVATGVSPYRTMMSNRIPLPMYAEGYSYGGQFLRRHNKRMDGVLDDERMSTVTGYEDVYPYIPGSSMTYNERSEGPSVYGGIDPVTVQANLRGIHAIAPPQGYMPGFNPELRYFSNDPEATHANAPITGPADWTQLYANSPINRLNQEGQPYFESILDVPRGTSGEEKKKPAGMAAGGDVTLDSSLGPMVVAGGGIADIPSSFNQAAPQQGAQPTEEDLKILAMAVLGRVEQPDQVVNQFIDRFGVDAFRAARDMILKMVSPNAQTEGMVQGQGGGMDDQVPGTMGDQQPVAVSPGEYIVPADVVSGLGDGSSEAGARQLDGMAQNVRMARGGTVQQPQPIDPGRVLPR